MTLRGKEGTTVALRNAARSGLIALVTAGLAWSGASAAMATDDPGDTQPSVSKPVKADKQTGPARGNPGNKNDKLGEKDRALLTQARAKGDKTVTLIMATNQGTTAMTIAAVKAAGGSVGKVVDEIGYVRATVPTASVEKVAANGDVISVDLNELIPLPDPRAEAPDMAPGARQTRAPTRAPRRLTTTPICRRVTSVRLLSVKPTRRMTAAASPSASSTRVWLSTIRRCRRRRRASPRSWTG